MPLAFQQHVGTAPGEHVVPEWIHLTPGGEVVRGRDGREFRVTDPQAIIKATELPMQLDVDHESMSYFGSTKAYGWIDKIEYLENDEEDGREAGFWGRAENWTPEGMTLVSERVFRGISPVIRVQFSQPTEGVDDIDEVPEMVSFVNAALTNRPNLRMTLLNRQEPSETHEVTVENPPSKEQPMHESLIQLARQLGLGSGCKPEELAHAVSEQMVPKTDLEAMEERAKHAESQIESDREAALNTEADHAISAAVSAGKVPPASKDFYRNSIHDRASLDAFVAEMKRRTPIVSPGGDPNDPPGEHSPHTTLTDDELAVAKAMNLSEQEMLDAKNSTAGTGV